jgi:hypothetical protein
MTADGSLLPDPPDRYADFWSDFESLRRTTAWRRLDPVRTTVLSNLAELTTFARPDDFLQLHGLIRRHGHVRVAAFQDGLDRLVGRDNDLPALTGLVWRIGDERHTWGQLTRSHTDPTAAADVAALCYGHMFWLLLTGINRAGRIRPPADPDEFARLIRHGSVRTWRATLAPVADHPWSPYGEELAVLADEAGLPVVADSLRQCRAVYQLRRQGEEKVAVSREIIRLVALSGVTQREFASYIGTSPSRLSTYVSGKVMPSAALMLRMQRASRLLRSRPADPHRQASSASTSTS